MKNGELSSRKRWCAMSPACQNAITALHAVLEEVKKGQGTRIEGMLYDTAKFIEDCEFTLQGLWGFPRDGAFHTHWLEVEGCRCPVMDNQDVMYKGLGLRVINLECPLHGKESKGSAL